MALAALKNYQGLAACYQTCPLNSALQPELRGCQQTGQLALSCQAQQGWLAAWQARVGWWCELNGTKKAGRCVTKAGDELHLSHG